MNTPPTNGCVNAGVIRPAAGRIVGADINPASPAFQAAARACGGLTDRSE